MTAVKLLTIIYQMGIKLNNSGCNLIRGKSQDIFKDADSVENKLLSTGLSGRKKGFFKGKVPTSYVVKAQCEASAHYTRTGE